MKTGIYMTLFVLGALSLTGCESTTTTNTVRTNSNTAVLTTTPSPSPSATMRRDNANLTRQEYDKNRADYEKEKGSSTIGQGANDSWLWFKTRAALTTTDDLRESTINVDVVNDVTTLKGTVANAAQKTKAEQVAKGIDGVKSVKNELKVAANDSISNQTMNGGTPKPTATANKR